MKKIIFYSLVVLFSLVLSRTLAQDPIPVWVNPGVTSKSIGVKLNYVFFNFKRYKDTPDEVNFKIGRNGFVDGKFKRARVRHYLTNNYSYCANRGTGQIEDVQFENVPFTDPTEALTDIKKSAFVAPAKWLDEFTADKSYTLSDAKEFWREAGTFAPKNEWLIQGSYLKTLEYDVLIPTFNQHKNYSGGSCLTSDPEHTHSWRYYHQYARKLELKLHKTNEIFEYFTLTEDNPSLYLADLLYPGISDGEIQTIIDSGILDYFGGNDIYNGTADVWSPITKAWGTVTDGWKEKPSTPLPNVPMTFYGQVKERYTLTTRELPYNCSSQGFDKNLADETGVDKALRNWMLNNQSNHNSRSVFAAYSDLACTNLLPEEDQPHIIHEGDMLRFTNVIAENGTIYLKFENGSDDIIYKVEATGGTKPEVAEEPELITSYVNYSSKSTRPRIKAVSYEPGTYFYRVDEVFKYNEETGTWPEGGIYTYVNTLDNGDEFPYFSSANLPEYVFSEGLYKYTYSAKSCTNSFDEVGSKYFISPYVEALVIDPEKSDLSDPEREINIDANNSTFTISSDAVKKIHFYTSRDITQVNTNVNLKSNLVRQVAGHHTARVIRTVPAGIGASEIFDMPWMTSKSGNQLEMAYDQLYKYEIDISDLPFNSPSFQFHFGTNQTYNINFINHTGPSNIEASPIEDIIDHLTLTINYLKDSDIIGENPSEPAVAQKQIFVGDAERTSGFETVDLSELGLTRTEVNRMKPEDISVSATPVSGGAAITEVRISYDHSYTNYLKLEFKTDGFTGPYTNAFVKLTYPSEPIVLNTPADVSKPVVLNDLFFNHVFVGQAIQVNSNQPLIVQPGLRLEKGSTLIVKETTNDILFEGLEYFENRNWIRTVSRDDYGQIRGDSKLYFDDFGELEQTQVKEFDHHLVLASEVVKDEYGRSVGQTLAAPVRYGHHEVNPDILVSSSYEDETMKVIPGYATFFEYAPDFVDRSQLNRKAFAGDKKFNPDLYADNRAPEVDATEGSSLQEGHLGWYYSPANAGSTHPLGEDHVPQTNFPYSRTIYYDDPSGEVFTQVPAGDYVWKDSDGSSRALPNTMTYNNYNYIEYPEDDTATPTIDESKSLAVNGNYQDGSFNLGSDSPIMSTMGQKEPITSADQTLIDKYLQVREDIFLNDDLNAQLPIEGPDFDYQRNGYKRRAFDYKGNETVSYFDASDNLLISKQKYIEPLNLGSSTTQEVHTFNVYDNAGRLHMAFTPKGTAELLGGSATYTSAEKTVYRYNRIGWLMSIDEPDAGTTHYIYRRDGLIRFSQNAQQAADGRFSYTTYDYLNRPIESGEASYSAYAGVTSFDDDDLKVAAEDRSESYSTSASPANRFDINRTYYDNEYTHFVDEVLEEGAPVQKLYINGSLMPDLTGVEYAVAMSYQQSYLGGAVSWSESLLDNNSAAKSRAVYSYDERGRVTWLAQYVPDLGIKMIQYLYGPMNNIIEVAYQPGEEDRFYHTYEYNHNGKLARAYASQEYLLDRNYLKLDSWKKEEYIQDYMIAAYDYYKHGPLKSVKLGSMFSPGSPLEGDEIYLQQLDYVYSINGALKSINNINDASQPGAFDDLFAMQLQYFNGDYVHSTDGLSTYTKGTGAGGTQTADLANIDIETDYTGNIKAMLWAHKNETVNTFGAGAESFIYDYDQAGQLSLAVFGSLNGNAIDHAGSFATRNLAYDRNGNIQTLTRDNGTGATLSQSMGGQTLTHDLTYEYGASGPNQLSSVVMPGNTTYQSNAYNNIGQLTSQTQLGTAYTMDYDVTGKMTQFLNTSTGATNSSTYNTQGFRDRKIDESAGNTRTEYFVRDANGKVLAIYEKPTSSAAITLKEVPLYAAGRVGVQTVNGSERKNTYEVKDHLGNVRGLLEERESFATPSEVSFWVKHIYDNDVILTESYCDKVVVTRGPDTEHQSSWNGVNIITYNYFYWQEAYDGQSFDRNDIEFEITENGKYYLVPYRVSFDADTGEELARLWVENAFIEVDVTLGQCEEVDLVLAQTTDYYPYGMSLPNSTTSSYRYGYQGEFSEKDEETGWNHYQLRNYDAIVGRWSNTDVYGQYYSPYKAMGNNPIYTSDPDGGFGVVGAVIGGAIGAGFSIAGQISDGTFDIYSGKTWARVGVATLSGGLAGSGVGLLAGAGLAAAGELGDQLIVNDGDISKTNITNVALAGGGAFLGGKAAHKLVHSGFFKKEIVSRVRASALDFKMSTGNTITNLSNRQISGQVINNIFGEGFGAYAGGTITNIGKDFAERMFNKFSNDQQNQMNFMMHMNILNSINDFKSGPQIIIEPIINKGQVY